MGLHHGLNLGLQLGAERAHPLRHAGDFGLGELGLGADHVLAGWAIVEGDGGLEVVDAQHGGVGLSFNGEELVEVLLEHGDDGFADEGLSLGWVANAHLLHHADHGGTDALDRGVAVAFGLEDELAGKGEGLGVGGARGLGEGRKGR